MLKLRWSLPSFLRLVLRKNMGSSRMPEFWQEEKRVGLHSAVFRELVLWPKGLGPTLWRKAAGTAKVRLVLVPWPEELAATRRVAFHPGRAAAALSNCY